MRVGDSDGVSAEADGTDEALNRFLPPDAVPGVPRAHRVVALVLARDGQEWLPRTLAGLSAQEHEVAETVGIDLRSADGSRQLLSDALDTVVALEADDPPPVDHVGDGLAAALAAGVRAARLSAGQVQPAGLTLAEVGPAPDDEAVLWYWILHDDSAPEPACLESLLLGADRNPKAAVVIPKTVAWSDRGRLVGVGTRWAPGNPVVDPLDSRERDQGQYDVDRPVYSGDSAGMLVRADAWHALGGMDPLLGDWAATPDLCRRVWGSGAEVFFIPTAVVAHRQATYRPARSSRDAVTRQRRAMRSGQLMLELSQAPAWALPWRTVRAYLTTIVRVLAVLLTREPEVAGAEVAGAWQVLGHPRRMLRARSRLRRPPVSDLRRPGHVRARRSAAIMHGRDRWSAAWQQSSLRPTWPPPASVWRPLAVVGVLAVASFVREPAVFLGAGTLQGGGLLPAPRGLDLLSTYLNSWHDVRFGTAGPLPAYLPLLAGASVVTLGSVDLLLRLALGFSVPLAYLSCYLSLRGHLRGRYRAAAALGYALLPAAVAGSGAGRLSTVAVLLIGPPTARLVVRAFTRTRAGRPGIRSWLAAGTMLGVVVAFAPTLFVVALAAGLVCWVVLGLPRWPVRTGVGILVVAALFLVLWLPRLLTAPWLALTEVGVNAPTAGSPQAWIWGLSPGGPTSVQWAGLPLLVAAGSAVLLAGSAPASLALAAAAGMLLAGSAWLAPLGASAWPEVSTGTWWPGVLLLLAGAALVLLVADQANRPGRPGQASSIAGVAALVALGVGWWLAPVIIDVRPGSAVPAVVALDADSPARPRSLVLGRSGASMTFAVAASAQPALGDADALAGSPVDPGFSEVVAGLVAGAGGAVERELGGRAIRYVVFDGPPEDPVVAELDATIGLRQLARAPEQSLWLVAGDPTRAELVTPGTDAEPGPASDRSQAEGGTPVAAPVQVPVLTRPTSIDVVVHPETRLPRQLVLAEQAVAGWWATSAGQDLALESDPQGMLRATLVASGDLRVGHRSFWPLLAGGQLVLFVVLSVLALPKRGSPEDSVRQAQP